MNPVAFDKDQAATAELREQTLLELAKRDTTDLEATYRAVTEAAAVLVDVARASVWDVIDDKLVCDDLFLRDEARHLSGQTIELTRCPTYFDSVSRSLVIEACDARNDSRTRELTDWYLVPLGIGAMLDTPVWQTGRARGVLCCEHVGGPRKWTSREERDAARMAELVARSAEASMRRAAEQRSKVILEAIPEYVIVVDEAGHVVEASAMARRAIEEEGGSSLATRCADLELHGLNGELIPPASWPVERARRGDAMRGEIVEISSRITGRRRWVRVTSALVTIGAHRRGAVIVYDDIAEEVRIECAKHDVLTAVAHELRTPTTIITGYAQRLLATPGRSPDETRALSAMTRAATRSQRLTQELIDLSAILLGHIILSMEHVELGDLVRQASERAPSAKTHPIRVAPSRGSVPVFVDPLRIRRVIGELIENAGRFSNVGSDIDIDLRVEDGCAKVGVHDHGVGISEAALSRVFEPLFRAHAGMPPELAGLGVGLFLAREIVARHGGSMTVESQEGIGSTFVVTLPLDQESP